MISRALLSVLTIEDAMHPRRLEMGEKAVKSLMSSNELPVSLTDDLPARNFTRQCAVIRTKCRVFIHLSDHIPMTERSVARGGID